MRKEMQTLLDDIELDIQELKYLMQVLATDANPTLKVVAKRNIQQMRARLDALQKLLDETPVEVVAIPEAPVAPVVIPEPTAAPEPVKPTPVEPVVVEITKPVEIVSPKPESESNPKPESEPSAIISSASPILAERIKPATDLRHAISLNDSFRFAREIFGGDTARMNEVIRQLGAAPSLEKALELFSSTVNPDEENETVVDFIELLKKYFS
ncbi:hypothetical protein [Bacteroides cellulosilyticus]|jgi:hypothetical protein|uniref:hypothetical protein n=1 Tax=Bacteroides cellulosilyticus TaxID=246787 RepID=UPI000E486E90|nr:hypothetical protein [Bacteroides cellulosilyticus]RGU28244.1 hypothetical protein DWW88_10200 [Bacteroides cellulosilyticus]